MTGTLLAIKEPADNVAAHEVIFAGTPNALWRSNNGGATWAVISTVVNGVFFTYREPRLITSLAYDASTDTLYVGSSTDDARSVVATTPQDGHVWVLASASTASGPTEMAASSVDIRGLQFLNQSTGLPDEELVSVGSTGVQVLTSPRTNSQGTWT